MPNASRSLTQRLLSVAITVSILLFLSFGAVAFGLYIYLYKSSYNTYPYEQVKLVAIHRGMSYPQILTTLQDAEVIRHIWPMKILGKLIPEAERIKPGRYYIPGGMTSSELILFLAYRKQDEVMVRIPEGSYGREIGGILGSLLDLDSLAFMRAFEHPELLKKYKVDAPNFEGYFLADTYSLPWASTPEDVIDFFLRKFRDFYTPELRERATRAGLTELEVLTLASIVEAETDLIHEMPIVASVYLNRLAKGMRLQADPTVLFAKGGVFRRVLYEDLKFDSPYNTYLYDGLPPGPIGNPSREAILAVLKPSKTGYLYFVANGRGGHKFAVTGDEHMSNVRVYHAMMKQKRDSVRYIRNTENR